MGCGSGPRPSGGCCSPGCALSDWGLARRGGPAGLDPDLFARAVFTLAEGAARLLLVDPQRWRVEAFVDFTRPTLAALRR